MPATSTSSAVSAPREAPPNTPPPTLEAPTGAAPGADPPRNREIGFWGTGARALFGVGLLALAVVEDVGIHTLVVAGLLTAALVAVQLARARRGEEEMQWTDPAAFCLNIAVFAVLASFDLTQSGLFTFYGLSALVAAARGARGCEVTAISNWLLRRNDQIGCPLFDPLDSVEAARRAHA